MASRLPSDALSRMSPRRAIALAAVGIVVVAGISVGGVALGNALREGLNHPAATEVALPADAPAPLKGDELAAVQEGADEQQAQIEADAAAKAAADVLAQQRAQAAADAAAKAAAERSAGPLRCPAGSTVVQGDAQGNDELCLPSICMHLSLPDPDHPECVTAFKP